jgi:hypothetical protein
MMRLALAHERSDWRCGHQRRIDLRLVAAARDVRAIRRGQGGANFDAERWALEFVPYGIRVNTVSPGYKRPRHSVTFGEKALAVPIGNAAKFL